MGTASRSDLVQREEMIARIRERREPWDIVVIGGGATGVGIAVDAASRGYSTLLVEQSDFGKGTSSRSTKLVHGGVRYLRQGNLKLVYEALHERGLLAKNAAHLVHPMPFVIPGYKFADRYFYAIGLKVYDLLAGKRNLGPSRILNKAQALDLVPMLEPAGLRGGVLFYDGQFDDSRLLVSLVRTAVDQGATLANYLRVTALRKNASGKVDGIVATDLETGEDWTASAKIVVNAAGVFCDEVRRLDQPDLVPMIRPSQGIHFVLDRSFLPGETAILVPHTDDGRVLFVIPWHGHALVGTTDTPVEQASLEPRALPEEVEFVLAHASRYLAKDPTPADVKSVYAGLRPLVSLHKTRRTSKLSRDHVIVVDRSGLLTITGGKWTTYRRMAHDAVDQAAVLAGLPRRACVTDQLSLRGCPTSDRNSISAPPLDVYGKDAESISALMADNPKWREPLHPALPYRIGQVIWAARNEMARTVDDVLARRTRGLFLDARAATEAAPLVASLLAEILGRDVAWQKRQVEDFTAIARRYVLS